MPVADRVRVRAWGRGQREHRPAQVVALNTSVVRHGADVVVGVMTRTPTDDARRVLGECVLFRDLDADERNVLFARVRVRSYAAGETIFLMGSAGDSLMAVLSGTVRISMPSPDGKEILDAYNKSAKAAPAAKK